MLTYSARFPKTEPPAFLTGSSGKAGACFPSTSMLCLNNPRRYEEDQLLVRGADRATLEQVAESRDIAQQRHLADVDRVLALVDPTDHDRATVGDQHLGSRLLCAYRRVALYRSTKVGRRVLSVHVQEDRTFRSDL